MKVEVKKDSVIIVASLYEARRLFADALCSDIDYQCDCQLCVAAREMHPVINSAQELIVIKTMES